MAAVTAKRSIQMKPLQQFFCMVLFVFQYFTKWNFGFFFFFEFLVLAILGVKELRQTSSQ